MDFLKQWAEISLWEGEERLEDFDNETIIIELCEAVTEEDLSVKITTSNVSDDDSNDVITSIRFGKGKVFDSSISEFFGETEPQFSFIKRVSLTWRQPGEKTMYLAHTEFDFSDYYIENPTPTAFHKAIVTTL